MTPWTAGTMDLCHSPTSRERRCSSTTRTIRSRVSTTFGLSRRFGGGVSERGSANPHSSRHMSLFEWLGEAFNPGPVGTIDASAPQPTGLRPRTIVIRGVLAAIAVVAILFGIGRAANTSAEAIIMAVVAAVYCAVAFWITPRPDYSSVGWAGGWIDNPFRWSDDANRALVVTLIILWPG